MHRIIIPIITILVAVVSVGSLLWQVHVDAGIDSRSLTAGAAAGVAGTSLLGLAVLEFGQRRSRRRRERERTQAVLDPDPMVTIRRSLLSTFWSGSAGTTTDPTAVLRTEETQ